MGPLLKSVEGEYRRYKAVAEAAVAQVPDGGLQSMDFGGGNSISVVVWHIGGNLKSRFTDFLESDGEKPWRNREEEFAKREPTREELINHWEAGWSVLFSSLSSLSDDQLGETVLIRGVPSTVHEALQRSLAHTAYHVGQIVFLAKSILGPKWSYLSIPPGGSEAYNQDPTSERAELHSDRLNGDSRK